MEHTIKIITGTHWLNLLKQNNLLLKPNATKLILDFSQTTFLNPYQIVSIACLVEEYSQKGVEIDFVKGSYQINRYLENIRFYEYWKPGFDRNKFTKLKIDTTMCLWKVSYSMIYDYATQAQRYFQNGYFEGKSLDSLHIALTEVFNNIFDHSKSPVDGYVLTQCFPNIGKIDISLCDFGVGIPAKINEIWTASGKAKLPDEYAIRAALVRTMSSKSTPHNKGFGLANLFDMVKKLNGEISIHSNNGVFLRNASGEIKQYRSNNFFSGTLITVSLYKSYLPDLEDEIAIDEFIL
jgi:hypothetical protein